MKQCGLFRVEQRAPVDQSLDLSRRIVGEAQLLLVGKGRRFDLGPRGDPSLGGLEGLGIGQQAKQALQDLRWNDARELLLDAVLWCRQHVRRYLIFRLNLLEAVCQRLHERRNGVGIALVLSNWVELMAQQVIQVLDREPTPLDRAYLLYELQRLAGEDILGQNGYRLAAERLERVQARHCLQRD